MRQYAVLGEKVKSMDKEQLYYLLVEEGTNKRRMNSETEPFIVDAEHVKRYVEELRSKLIYYTPISIKDYEEKFPVVQ